MDSKPVELRPYQREVLAKLKSKMGLAWSRFCPPASGRWACRTGSVSHRRAAGSQERTLSIKVVFLDFDGVLNSKEFFKSPRHEESEAGALDPEAIARLNRLLAATGAVVVISSSWRHGYTVGALASMLESRGFVGAYTTRRGTGSRRPARSEGTRLPTG